MLYLFVMSDNTSRDWSRTAAQNNSKPLDRLVQLCRQERRFLVHIRTNMHRIALTESEADAVAMRIVALSRDMPLEAIRAAQNHCSIAEEPEGEDEEPMPAMHTIVVHCALYIGDIVRALPQALAACDDVQRIVEASSLLQSIHAELQQFGIETPASSGGSSPSTSSESCA